MMYRITEDNLVQILLAGESDTVEFKRFLPKSLDIIERLISAFANTQGGSVIFGYDEQKKEIVGIDHEQVQKLERKFNNQNRGCSVYTIELGDKLLAILDVEKAKTDMYVKGVAYIRNGGMVYSKVGDIRSRYLKQFVEEIQYRNRNPRNIKVLELLEDTSTNPERSLDVGSRLYRCRVIHDMSKVNQDPGFYGYGKKESFVPPPNVTRDLRANYRYIPYLYCANNPYTALVEVRPRLGANVSIATINVDKKLTLLDFTMKNSSRNMKEAKLNLFADLSMLFSKPVTSDDDILDYIPTQYIAEYVKNLDYDGIVFRSSLTPEIGENEEVDRYNVVVFNYDKCSVIGSNVVQVTRNYFECKQVDQDENIMDIHAIIG